MSCEHYRSDLLDVLYGEATSDERARFDAHASGCEACRTELDALRGVRASLPEWSVPRAPAPLVVRHWQPPAWAWLAAAAACLVVAAGAALRLSGAQLRLDAGPLRVAVGEDPARVEQLIAEQEARHRTELQRLQGRLERAAAPVLTAADPGMLQRIQHMIQASETRQLELLDAAWTDYATRSEAQRRLDLARVSAGLSVLEQRTGEHAELIGYVLESSQQR